MTTEAQYTPEPWELDERYGSLTGHYQGRTIRILDAPDYSECDAQEKAEALAELRRAKACVNALKGIRTEALEQDRLIDLLIYQLKESQAFITAILSFYGQGLEVTNWHLNGDTEPFDNFIDENIPDDLENRNAAALAKLEGKG